MKTRNPCPKFASCNAPYCPLDENRAHTTTNYREPSCIFLREAAKDSGKVPAQIRPQIDESAKLVLAGDEGGTYLRTVLERASQCGSSRGRVNGF